MSDTLSGIFAIIASIIYAFAGLLAARYSIRVWPKTSITVGISSAAELLTDGFKAFAEHAKANSHCPWLMVKPARLTFSEHLSNVFLSYPRFVLSGTSDSIKYAVRVSWEWFMAFPTVFGLSIFALIYSGITTFFFVKTIMTGLERANGATKEEAPFW